MAAHKPTNLSTEANVKQSLQDASGGMPTIYTSPDSEDPENLKGINLAFVIQLVSDVHEKKAKNGWVCRDELVRTIRNSPKSI